MNYKVYRLIFVIKTIKPHIIFNYYFRDIELLVISNYTKYTKLYTTQKLLERISILIPTSEFSLQFPC